MSCVHPHYPLCGCLPVAAPSLPFQLVPSYPVSPLASIAAAVQVAPAPTAPSDPQPGAWNAAYELPQGGDGPRLPLAIQAMLDGDVDGFAREYAAAEPDERAEIEKSLEEMLRLADADACRRDFGTFYRYFWPEISPTRPIYVENPGTEALIVHAQAVADRKINKLAVACAPGFGKSSALSVAYPAFMWARDPSWRVLCASHTQALAHDLALKFHRLVTSDKYKRLFPEVVLESDAVSKMVTTKGGIRYAVSVGGTLTGMRGVCFAGDTLVSTEWGEIPIEVLHEMAGTVPLPRVWAFDHANGLPVLVVVNATSHTPGRNVVEVSTESGNVVTCTPDHPIWADQEYRHAEDITGRTVSILRGADFQTLRSRDQVREVLGDHVPGQATVQTDHVAAVCRRDQAVDVYDLQVVGHNNFFAGGVLVHNCGIIDDSLNADDADNADKIAGVNEWIASVWSTRFDDSPGAPQQMLGIQQRLAENDMIWFMKSLGAEVLELAARYDPDKHCTTSVWTDPRTTTGQVLAPEIHSEAFLEQQLQTLKPRKFASQYLQQPSAREGNQFKLAHWGWFQMPGSTGNPHPARLDKTRGGQAHVLGRRPDGGLDVDWVTVSVDPTGGSVSETASALGLGIVAGKGLRRFVLEDLTPGPRGPSEQVTDILRAIVRAAQIIGTPGPKLTVLVEKKALGVGIMAQIETAIADGARGRDADGKPVDVPLLWPDGQRIVCTVLPYEPTGKGSKEARADHMEAPIEAGLVHLLDGATWVPAFVSELGLFPGGTRDDRVDYLAQVLDHHRPPIQKQVNWTEALKGMSRLIGR